MICQEDYLLYRYIERLKQNFLEQGGIREEMSRARKEYRGY
jgi:four helix bundle suffix protein